MLNYIQPLLFVLTLVSYSAADGCKKVCVLDKDKCVTKGGSDVWDAVANSTTGEPLDPLKIEEIDGEKGQIQYKLKNIRLYGLKKCKLTQLLLNVTEKSYTQYMLCPKLTSTFNYEAKESNSGSVVFSETGKAKGTAYHSVTLITGIFGVFVSEKDHYPHFYVLNNVSSTYFHGSNGDCAGEFLLSLTLKPGFVAVMNGIDALIRKLSMGGTFPEDNDN